MHSVGTILAFGLGMAAAAAAPDHRGKASHSPNSNNPSTSSVTDDYMGPSAFMWPPDRVWSGDMDNQPPCGSRAAAGNRTKFPLTGGAVALVAQDDYYNSKISISYSNDPKTNTEFTTLIQSSDVNDLNPGHTCAQIPDAPARVTAGTNATLQIVYKADWDAPHNQTFYACADITYVAATDFTHRIPCFNATEPGEDDRAAADHAADTPASGPPNASGQPDASGGSKMAPSAVAGAVVGSLVGASVLAAGAFFLYRRSQQKQRALRLSRMEENARHGQYPLDKLSSQRSG